VRKILQITKEEDYQHNPQKQTKVKELERIIDQHVCELYALTEEKIGICEAYGN